MKLYVVVGLGQFGRHVAMSLHNGGGDVLAIDQDARRVDDIKDNVGQAVCMDATDMGALRAVGAAKAQTAVVALGEDDLEASILTCASLSDLGIGTIIVRAENAMQERILTRVGATRVVFPEMQMGQHIAKSILMSGVIDQVTLSTGQTVAQIRPRRDLVGKSLKDSELRVRFSINVIGIQHERHFVDDNGESQVERVLKSVPSPDDIIDEDDILVVVGNQAQIELITRKD